MQASGSIEYAAVSRTTNRGTAGTVELTEQRLEHYRLHAEVCRVLTDPKRLMHLAVLRTAGLVEGRRIGTTVVYRLAEPAIADACDIISAIVARRLGRAVRPAAERADHVSIHVIQG